MTSDRSHERVSDDDAYVYDEHDPQTYSIYSSKQFVHQSSILLSITPLVHPAPDAQRQQLKREIYYYFILIAYFYYYFISISVQ